MELSGYIAVVRRWWWTLLVAAWVAGLTGFLVASQIPPTYESRVSLLVGPINTDQNTLRASGQLVQTYAQLVTTAPLLDSAIQETKLSITPAELVPAIRATANDVTRILSIRVQSGSPEDAAKIANAIATELIQLASRGIGRPEGQVQIIEPAALITVPVAPQVSILVLLAAGAGLIGALVIVLLIEYLSDSVRSREDLVRTSGGTPLGIVGTGGPELLAIPSGRVGQSYLLLAAKLILAREARDTASILVLDATTTRTASVVAANLAAAVGRLGRKAIVIDGAPGQQGGLTRVFGLEGRAGVSDFLVGTATRDLASMAEGINIVPSGTIDLPAIDVDRCRDLVTTVSRSHDVVLVATAPVTESAIATVWARACDGAILIAERDHSRRSDVALATESLALVERPLIGVVLAERGRSLRGRGRSVAGEPIQPAAVRIRAPERSWDANVSPRPSSPTRGDRDDAPETQRSYGPDPDAATIAALRPTTARPPDMFRAAAPPPPSAAPFRLSTAVPAAMPSSADAPTRLTPAPPPTAAPFAASRVAPPAAAASPAATPHPAAPVPASPVPATPHPAAPVPAAPVPAAPFGQRPFAAEPVPITAERTPTPIAPGGSAPLVAAGAASAASAASTAGAASEPTTAQARVRRTSRSEASGSGATVRTTSTRTGTSRSKASATKPGAAKSGAIKGGSAAKGSTTKGSTTKGAGSAKAAATAKTANSTKAGNKKSATASPRRRTRSASSSSADELSG